MMASSECLYNNIVPVFLKTGSGYTGGGGATGSQFGVPTTMTTDCGRRVETIVFELLYTPAINGRRSLEIKLTDSNDPFFLWQCTVSEEEYFVLRREQNLLVDYTHFPYKLVELLQQCVAHAREDRPAFSATLQVTPEDLTSGRSAMTILTISESTSFRQITHLALRFNQMSEQGLRKHLANVVKHYKEEIDGLRSGTGGQYPVPPGRVDFTRQPSMPFFPENANRPMSNDERLRSLEMQNQQLNNQKMALEGEVIDLRNRLGLSGGQTTTHHRGGHQPYGSSETRDIHKANEIIRKLQDECKSLRNRARSAETALKQLEKVAKETLTSYETLRTELQEARTQLAEKTRTLADTQAERDKLSLEVEETRKLVEANEKVIEWLHQQINEDSISRMLGRTGPGPIGTLPVNLGNGAPFKYTSAPLNRFSPESWLGKAKIPEPASSSSTTPPDHF